MKYYLGIDGGGTKTRATLINENFEVLMDSTYEGSHLITCGDEKFITTMTNIVADAKKHCKEISYIFCALAGYGEFKQDNDRIEKHLKSVYNDIPYTVLNDSVGVWAGGLLCENGIGLIAGTGSNCAGVVGNKYERVGGWGYLAGDESSAYWIALKTVNNYMKMKDGRISPTILIEKLDKEYNLSEENNILKLIYRDMDCQRPEIAQIAKICNIAASEGCEVSKQILKDAAYEIVEHIKAITNKLDFGKTIPISYTGGVFNSDTFVNFVKEYLSNLDHNYELCAPIANASYGSALYAYILDGNTLSDEHRENIKKANIQ